MGSKYHHTSHVAIPAELPRAIDCARFDCGPRQIKCVADWPVRRAGEAGDWLQHIQQHSAVLIHRRVEVAVHDATDHHVSAVTAGAHRHDLDQLGTELNGDQQTRGAFTTTPT